MGSKSLFTTGEASSLSLEPETLLIPADNNSLAFIQVSTRDSEGRLILNDAPEVSVKVKGPATLQAAGNASPEHEGSFSDENFQLFRGRGMVILRSTGEAGEIQLEVSSRDLTPAQITLVAE